MMEDISYVIEIIMRELGFDYTILKGCHAGAS
jgi:hypothetical protein